MAFQPGQSGNPAGRPKGARNKRVGVVLDILEKHQYNPVEHLISIAQNEEHSDALRMEAAKAILPYVLPKLRQTQISAAGDQAVSFHLNLAPKIEKPALLP